LEGGRVTREKGKGKREKGLFGKMARLLSRERKEERGKRNVKIGWRGRCFRFDFWTNN
jgi:hypothetical protein